MANATYSKKNAKGTYVFDLKKILPCKGIFKLKVYPSNPLDTLILDGIKSDLITYKNPFVIESPVPIINMARLTFEPFNSDSNIKITVEMLLEN